MGSTGMRPTSPRGDVDERVQSILLGLLERSSKAARRLNSRGDAEALHDFRTLVRRMRSVLKEYRQVLGRRARRFERELREIADHTGAGRDAEVQLQWLEGRRAPRSRAATSSAGAMRKRLERERRRGYALARREAVPAFLSLAAKMDGWLRQAKRPGARADAPSADFGALTAAVLRESMATLRRRLNAIASPRDEVLLHRARIRGKRLRYVLEPLEQQYPLASEALAQLKALQDVLGEIHDRHVLLNRLRDTDATPKGRGVRPRLWARALRADATKELRQRFGDLRREWLEGGLDALVARIEQLASQLESNLAPALPEAVEIERKYLLKRLPEEVLGAPASEIWQGWIPGDHLQERLRRVAGNGHEDLYRTVKLGRGIQRTEIEERTPPALFERMWPLTEGRRVLKRRYVLEDAGRKWEIDEFLDRQLYLAEVELPSVAAQVSLPSWLAPAVEREVTGEDAFVNVNLAR